MARSAKATVSAQPLPGSDGSGTITIDVAAKLLMVPPEWVRRLAKDGWITRPSAGATAWSTSCGAVRALKGASAMRPSQVASDEAP